MSRIHGDFRALRMDGAGNGGGGSLVTVTAARESQGLSDLQRMMWDDAVRQASAGLPGPMGGAEPGGGPPAAEPVPPPPPPDATLPLLEEVVVTNTPPAALALGVTLALWASSVGDITEGTLPGREDIGVKHIARLD